MYFRFLAFCWKLNTSKIVKSCLLRLVFRVIIMAILLMLCFPSFLTISYRFQWCYCMFLLMFLRFPHVFLLFALRASLVSYFRFRKFFFVKQSKTFFTVKINNKIRLRLSFFNYFNYKNFLTPFWKIAFCKNIFI